jgi:hypothetical protein
MTSAWIPISGDQPLRGEPSTVAVAREGRASIGRMSNLVPINANSRKVHSRAAVGQHAIVAEMISKL